MELRQREATITQLASTLDERFSQEEGLKVRRTSAAPVAQLQAIAGRSTTELCCFWLARRRS